MTVTFAAGMPRHDRAIFGKYRGLITPKALRLV
jgi:hypothetical protein